MYLYMYSDGVRQTHRPPDESEQKMVRDDELRIFYLESGDYQEYTVINGKLVWRSVEHKDR